MVLNLRVFLFTDDKQNKKKDKKSSKANGIENDKSKNKTKPKKKPAGFVSKGIKFIIYQLHYYYELLSSTFSLFSFWIFWNAHFIHTFICGVERFVFVCSVLL